MGNGSIYEYDEEAHFRTLIEEGREDGEIRVNKLNSILIDMGRIDDLKRTTQDKAYQEQLMCELFPEDTDARPEGVSTHAEQMTLDEAVEKTVNECISEGILSEFLRKNRTEVIEVTIGEFQEELHFKALTKQGREEGETRVNQLNSILIDMGRIGDLKRATQDKAYQEQLMAELLPE